MVVRHIVNAETGEVTEVVVEDVWIKAWRGNEVLLSLSSSTITGDGVDETTLTAQLVTAPLTDLSQENVSVSQTIRLQIGDIEQDIVLDANGAWSDTITSEILGDYVIKTLLINSNELTLGVI